MEIEPDSKTWRALEAWADKQLTVMRAALEEPGMPERHADSARGAIALLKQLKRLGDRPDA